MAEKEIGKLVINIEARLANLEKGLKTAESKVNQSNTKMINSFKSVAGAMGVTFGAAALVGFAKKSIDAYAEQEKANKKLETALGRTSKALLDYASAIQFQSTFADEQIVEANARFAMFIKEEDMIKRMTDVTRDFAAAKGIDLVSAADLLSKTVGSSTNALARYGINIEGAAGSTERINNAIRELNKLFKGQDLAQASTEAGKLANQLKKLDEIAEDLGGKLLPLIVDFGNELKEFTDGPLAFFEKDLKRIWNFVSSGFKAEMPTLQGTSDELKKERAAIDKMMNKSTANAKEKTKDELEEEKKALEEREAKQAEFYNTVKFLSDKYYKWKTDQIEIEKLAYIKATNDKVAAEIWANQQLFDLALERSQIQAGKDIMGMDIKGKGLESIPMKTGVTDKISDEQMELLKKNYEDKLNLEVEYQDELTRMRDEANISQVDMAKAAYGSIGQGFQQMIQKMLLIESSSNNILIQGFVTMANAFVSEVARMIAQWVAFQVVKGIFGALFAPLTGGASALAAVAGVGGERVEINPMLGGGIDRNDVNTLVTVIKAMNMNLANRLDNVGVTVINNAPDVRTTVIRNKKIENRLTREGKNLSE